MSDLKTNPHLDSLTPLCYVAVVQKRDMPYPFKFCTKHQGAATMRQVN